MSRPVEQPVERAAAVGARTVPVQRLVRPRPAGPLLNVREFRGDEQRGDEFRGDGRPFLLVHGLASNARVWDGVARILAAHGHQVVAVDLRGHGLSEAPDDGYDTGTAADDLVAVAAALGLRAPVAVGQSWGGNVVLSLAARHPGVPAAVACVDGGWLRPRASFASFDECWSVLAPPVLDGVRYADLAERIRAAHPDWPEEGIDGTLGNLVELPGGGVRARLAREHHREILRSMYEQDPAHWYPLIGVPVLLMPAVGAESSAADPVRAALAAMPSARARWYPGADHDLHAQYPDRLASDLENLAHGLNDLAHGLDRASLEEAP